MVAVLRAGARALRRRYLMRLDKIEVPVATNVATGETREIYVDPHVYTSVVDWKPIPAEQFAALLHDYQTLDESIDRFGHGQMHTTAFRQSRDTTVIITYIPKSEGDPVSSPVLMTIRNERTLKLICFASLRYGLVAEDSPA